MKLNEMESFLAVAEAGSIQNAARRIGLTQSAVSRLIQRLEAEIGADLFDRTSKPLRLTRAGENALVHCRRVMRAIDDFSSEFSPEARPSGAFRLGISPAVSAFAARGPIEHLRSRFPELSIRLTTDWTSTLIEQTRKGDLDAALVVQGTGHEDSGNLQTRKLQQERVHIIAPKSVDPDRLHSLEALNDLGWALLPEGCRYRDAVVRSLDRLGQPINIAIEAFDQELLILMVARGAAVGLVPMSMLAVTPFLDQVRVVDCPDFRLDVSFCFVRGRYPGRMSPALDAIEAGIDDIIHAKHSKVE